VLLASGLLVSLFLMPSAASDIYSALLVGGIGVLLLLTIYYRRMERPSAQRRRRFGCRSSWEFLYYFFYCAFWARYHFLCSGLIRIPVFSVHHLAFMSLASRMTTRNEPRGKWLLQVTGFSGCDLTAENATRPAATKGIEPRISRSP